jgi:hypothetical protein
LTLAVSGTLIVRFPAGMFFVPLLCHAAALVLVVPRRVEPGAACESPHDAMAEPGLLGQRRLALQLSRIALPATYVVVYSLVALMPSLRTIQAFSPARQTIVASVWMGARFLAFLILGATAWWHTRPRILLWAAVAMLAAFLGVTLSGAAGAMILWQIPLGFAMGMIYTGSLYFGMVLSQGSTEHGGYHEALIGLGQVIGPAAALGADRAFPADWRAAVIAVAALVLVSVGMAAAVTAKQAGRRE